MTAISITLLVLLTVAVAVAAAAALGLRARRRRRTGRAPTANPTTALELVVGSATAARSDDRVVALEVVNRAASPTLLADGAARRTVVLVHGILGFDQIRLPGVRIDYFRGIAEHLAACGVTTVTVRLPALASVPERARILADRIVALGGPVDVVAHSLGGLDARWAIARLGLADRVASLVTIGTPHRGTPIADLVARGPLNLARKVVGKLGMTTAAVDWLTTEALDRFNREVPDMPGVRYGCIVAGARTTATSIPLALRPAHAYLRRVSGPSDGLVPLTSQVWGEVWGEIEADHWMQVGWSVGTPRDFDVRAFYSALVGRLHGKALPAPPTRRLLTASTAT